jgi:hypothetical protein
VPLKPRRPRLDRSGDKDQDGHVSDEVYDGARRHFSEGRDKRLESGRHRISCHAAIDERENRGLIHN